MKKLILIALFVAGMSSAAFARDVQEGKWALSVQSAAVMPRDDDNDDTIYYGGRLTYDITPNVAVGVESGWMNFEQEADGIDFGDQRGIPLLADIVLKLPIEATDNKLVPYVLGGVGVVFWDYQESSILKDNGFSVDSDTAFAARIGGGVEYYVSNNVALFLEGSYLFSTYDAKVRYGSSSAANIEVDSDAFFAGGGVKVGF